MSEQRVHNIIRETIAQNKKRGELIPKASETRPHDGCWAEQRVTLRSKLRSG
jgi:hypothetical protein